MRPPRINISDYPYHVFMRGNNKQTLFRDDKDRLTYHGILLKARKKFPFRLHTYAFMDNHIHLMLQMNEGYSLSQLMHWTQLGFARHFNERHDHVGHVFQSRYNARLIEKDDYFLTVDRYIHLNPVRAGMVRMPEDFVWSSYRSRLGLEEDPLVEHEEVLSYFGNSLDVQRKKYQRFTEEGIGKPEEWSQDDLIKSTYLGSAEFVLKIQGLAK